MVGKDRQRRSTVKIAIKGRAGGCQLSFSPLQNLRFAFPPVQRYRRSFRCCRYGNRSNFARTGTLHRRLALRDYAPHVGVGRPDVQGFVGSPVGFGATKGVFVTTSSFSAPAIDFVRHLPQRVVLIDGACLVELMIEHGVGVRVSRTIAVKRLDEDCSRMSDASNMRHITRYDAYLMLNGWDGSPVAICRKCA